MVETTWEISEDICMEQALLNWKKCLKIFTLKT